MLISEGRGWVFRADPGEVGPMTACGVLRLPSSKGGNGVRRLKNGRFGVPVFLLVSSLLCVGI